MIYPILLNDGTSIHADYEFEQWLDTQGITPAEFESIAEDLLAQRISSLNDAYHEQEMIADGYACRVRELVDELDEVASMLESGKSGRGYTKTDIAGRIRTLVSNLC